MTEGLDLSAAAKAEHARRRAEWRRLRADAANATEAARITTAAQGDLAVWGAIHDYLAYHDTPAEDSRPMARSARATLDRFVESGKADDAKIRELWAITRALETHVLYRHGRADRAAAVADRRAA